MMEKEGNQANVEQELIASTGTDDMKSMPSGPQPVLTQESLASELPTPILNLANNALDQGLEVLVNVLVGENS